MNAGRADILIAGGGPAGLVAAAGFSAAGRSVVLLDPAPPITRGDAPGSDLRSTAFLQPARALFERIGLWPALAPHAVPLEALRIVDTVGTPPAPRDKRIFRSRGSGSAEPLGWNFLNWVIRRELLGWLERRGNVDLRFGTGFSGMIRRSDAVLVSLSDGSRIRARLVVGADGRDSPVREAAGIGVRTTRYGQKSLAFTATHEQPHGNVSTEIYHEGGPFTMVPLADVEGRPASAIVWMNPGRRAVELLEMTETAFNAAMEQRAAGLFRGLRLASGRALFPIISQRAERLTAARVALVAEAAHVLPPIGAQGLNTSLNDIAALLEATGRHPEDPGRPEALAAYEGARLRDIARRARAIDLFNRVTRSGRPALQALRLSGLRAAHDIAPLRRALIRVGMGPG